MFKTEKVLFLKNISYSFLANIFSLLISAIAVLIIPKNTSVTDYGYFQLYLFYVSYVGIMHFGWADGAYLRYGGERIEEINKPVIRTQFWLLTLISFIVSLTLGLMLPFIIQENTRITVLIFTCLCSIVMLPRTLIWMLLQATGNIIEYSKCQTIEKVVYILSVVGIVCFSQGKYQMLICADIFGKVASLLITIYYFPELFWGAFCDLTLVMREVIENISAGFKLMVANVASTLIIGIVRFAIEGDWGIDVFAKISLTLTICNLILVFINSIGLVLFPFLKRTNADQMKNVYIKVGPILSTVLYGALLVSYPLKYVFLYWLPQYADSISFMMLLFPISLFECKTALIYNTYLKIFREEKTIMSINVSVVLLSCLLVLTNICFLQNLDLMLLSIVILLAVRCFLEQKRVCTILKEAYWRDVIDDCFFAGLFIICGKMTYGFWIYCVFLCIKIYQNKWEIINFLEKL